ncbi:MAG: UDP-glucose 4-epimerase GalE [Thiolinea sp.]
MSDKHTVLVTGGAGYIGSHTCLQLLEAGYELVVIDNLCNSSLQSLQRVAELSGRNAIPFYQGDIRDKSFLQHVFVNHRIHSVMHFAGLKAVGESVEKPLAYYDNNVTGTLTLLEVMQAHGVRRMVFSSSATVYGDPASTPIREDFTRSATNPYGRSKLMIEDILIDLHRADAHWQIALLRYFNPVGAHASGRMGEDPNGIPNNLMPYITRVAVGQYPELSVFGNDYSTPDGTGVRDYIHVVDLANGHVRALQAFASGAIAGLQAINLGTGRGYSVLELVQAFEAASGRPVPYRIVERRAGDIATCFADPRRASEVLGWQAERGLEDMCRDAWNWQQQNPQGYA